jgi:hypothetical protein
MKRIIYGGGSILTGDRIADALLDYAAVLARAGTADHVRVPALAADDEPTVFDIVLGPASQIMAEREGVSFADVEDEAFIDDLALRSRMATAGRTDQIGRDVT